MNIGEDILKTVANDVISAELRIQEASMRTAFSNTESMPVNHRSSPSSLRPLAASRRLCGLRFGCGFAALSILLASQTEWLLAQNIPPMIGDHVGKPKLRIPNPLEGAQKSGSQTSESSQSGQSVASPAGEREIQGFLENWRSVLSKKDAETLSRCYLQT